MGRQCIIVPIVVLVVVLSGSNVGASSCRPVAAGVHNIRSSTKSSSSSLCTLQSLRAGASGETRKKKKGQKKKGQKKKKKSIALVVDDAEPVAATDKKAIQEAMKEKDTAEAMGDAIRDRAEDWFRDDPLLYSIDATVSSVGWAMGTAVASQQQQQQYEDHDDGGGVETATSSVLAHYFLKSHGGAHALQSACSLFAVVLSLMALVVAPVTKNPGLQTVLLKRAFLCAMTKHLAGLLAATGMTATAIPKIGLGKARRWMEQLARDPVSQYVFYSALLMVWLSTPGHEWYSKTLPYGAGKYIPLLLVGPVMIREAISTAFVISDVVLLLQASSPDGSATAMWWKTCTAAMNAFMSLLVTPTVWRMSTASQRQVILAKLTAKTSLAIEVCVGLLLVMDAVMALWQFTVLVPRPSLVSMVQRILCARLYVNFLWVRRKKIQHLSRDIRGGAGQIPIRILDVLYDPLAEMGIQKQNVSSHSNA